MIEAIGIGVFAFVALSVAGWRAIDAAAAARRERERARLAKLGLVRSRYEGPLYNEHGREIRA